MNGQSRLGPEVKGLDYQAKESEFYSVDSGELLKVFRRSCASRRLIWQQWNKMDWGRETRGQSKGGRLIAVQAKGNMGPK